MKTILMALIAITASACAEPWQNTVPAPKVYTGADLPVEHAIQKTRRIAIRCERLVASTVECSIQ